MGLSTFIPAGVKIRKEIPAGQVLNLVVLPITTFESVKLLVNYKVNSSIQAFELFLANIDGEIQETITSKIGDNLQILTKPQIIGSDVVLAVTNNESSVCSVTILQLN